MIIQYNFNTKTVISIFEINDSAHDIEQINRAEHWNTCNNQ